MSSDPAFPATDHDLQRRVTDLLVNLQARPAIYVSNAMYPSDIEWDELFQVEEDGRVWLYNGIDSLKVLLSEIDAIGRRR